MKTEWITRDDGTRVLPMPGRTTLLAEIIRVSPDRWDVWILDRMRWTSAPDLRMGKRAALDMIRRTCGEILVAIAEDEPVPAEEVA